MLVASHSRRALAGIVSAKDDAAEVVGQEGNYGGVGDRQSRQWGWSGWV